MQRRSVLAIVLALGGCAPAVQAARPAVPVATAALDAPEEAEAARVRRERVRELEAALGLAQAEVRELRDEVRGLRAAERTRATHIGARCPPAQEAVAGDVEPSSPEERSSRPVLRLYGTAGPSPASLTPIPGPPPPLFVEAPPPPSLRLPVVAAADGVPTIPAVPIAVVPALPLGPVPAREAAPARPRADEAAERAYRGALALVAERRLEEALSALDAFMRDHPGHAYADNAQYWRGEIHYTRRDYRRALAEFTVLLERFPDGNKVPEALLRIGLCHERMGDRERAQRAFQRLRTQYPDSVAARMAAREDV